MTQPETIQIKLDDKRTLSAVHGKPAETKLAERDKKLVIMMHGFPSHKDNHDKLYAALASILNDQGFHTLCFDFIGCGDSIGEQPDFSLRNAKESLGAVKEWAHQWDYKDLIFVSEGIGSLAAILNADLSVTCQIMLWPGLDPQYLAKNLFQSDTIEDEWLNVGYVVKGDDRIGIPFINELLSLKLAPALRDINMPVLIMHGSADSFYPVDHLNIARQGMPSKRIEITTFHNAEHGLPEIEHRKSMFFHIGQFLEKYA